MGPCDVKAPAKRRLGDLTCAGEDEADVRDYVFLLDRASEACDRYEAALATGDCALAAAVDAEFLTTFVAGDARSKLTSCLSAVWSSRSRPSSVSTFSRSTSVEAAAMGTKSSNFRVSLCEVELQAKMHLF